MCYSAVGKFIKTLALLHLDRVFGLVALSTVPACYDVTKDATQKGSCKLTHSLNDFITLNDSAKTKKDIDPQSCKAIDDPVSCSFVLANFENKVLRSKINVLAVRNQLVALAKLLTLEEKHNGNALFIHSRLSRHWAHDGTPDDNVVFLEKCLDRQHMACHYQ